MKTVALLSGGIDSVVMLYQLQAWGHDVMPMIFDYGQRAEPRERRAAYEICRRLRLDAVDQHFPLKFLHDAALLHVAELPDAPADDPSQRVTVVPMRNTIMLSFAAALAMSANGDAVAYGATHGDAAVYPDCRFDFVCRYRDLLRTATEGRVAIMAPFVEKTKSDVVKLGAQFDVPFQETWSCYADGADHCGRCGACQGRRQAFAEAGIVDPTTYAA